MEPEAELAHVREVLLRRYGIEASEVRLLDEGSTPNHAVTASTGEQYLVKALRSRLGAWVAENAQQITGLAAHAAAHGLPTPKPVETLGKALVASEPGPREGEETHFVVLPWAVGYQRADLLLAAEPGAALGLLAELGGILATLHSLPLPEGVKLVAPEEPGGHCLCDMGTFLEHASDPSGFFTGEGGPDAIWFREWLPRMVELWQGVPEPRAVCHGDAYMDNVLAKKGAAQLELLLIDWEDACVTCPVVDLGACAVGTCFSLSLGEGSEDVTVALIEDRLAALVSGYERQRALTGAERELLRPCMQACAWACGAFRYGRFLEGVTDLKTRKYGQLIEVVELLEKMGPRFASVAFAAAAAAS